LFERAAMLAAVHNENEMGRSGSQVLLGLAYRRADEAYPQVFLWCPLAHEPAMASSRGS